MAEERRTTMDPEGSRELELRELVGEAMQDAWNEICDDTGCHPLDITRNGKLLYFSRNHWADLVALRLQESLSRPDREVERAIFSELPDDVQDHVISSLQESWAIGNPAPEYAAAMAELAFNALHEKGLIALSSSPVADKEVERANDAAFIEPDDPLYLRPSKECLAEIERAEQERLAGYAAVKDIPLDTALASPSVEKLVEALEPFAKAAHSFNFAIGPDGVDDGLTVTAFIECRREYEATLSTGDFSRARSTLSLIRSDRE
jgi:hypothetical protein